MCQEFVNIFFCVLHKERKVWNDTRVKNERTVDTTAIRVPMQLDQHHFSMEIYVGLSQSFQQRKNTK